MSFIVQLMTKRSIFIIVFILAALLVAFLPLFYGNVIYEEDAAYYYLPAFKFYSDAVKAGESVAFTPGIFSGFPLALSQVGGFYDPLNYAIFKYFPYPESYHVRIVFNYFLAGLFTFFLARTLGLSVVASLIATFAYLTAQDIIAGANILRSNSYFIMPGLFLAVYGLFTSTFLGLKGKWKGFMVWGFFLVAVFGEGLLSGYTQLVIYGFIAAMLFAVFLFLQNRPWLFPFILSVFILITLAILLPYLLDVLALVPASYRADGLSWDAASAGVSLPRYLSIITVNLFLPPWQDGTVQSLYLGFVGFLFFIISFLYIRRDKFLGFFGFLAGFSIVCTFPYPLFYIMYQLPVLDFFRFPPHWFAVTSFALSMMAAYGYDRFLRCPPRLLERLRVYCGTPAASTSIVLFVVLNFIAVMWFAIDKHSVPTERLTRIPETIRGIKISEDVSAEPFRTYHFYPGDSEWILLDRSLGASFLTKVDYRREYVQTHLSPLFWGVASVRGYDNLVPRRYEKILSSFEEKSFVESVSRTETSSLEDVELNVSLDTLHRLGMMNVKYLLTPIPLPKEYVNTQIVLVGKNDFIVSPDPSVPIVPIYVYENKEFLPRLWAPPYISIISEDEEKSFSEIFESSHDFKEQGLIECGLCGIQDMRQQETLTVLHKKFTNNTVEARVHASADTWLIVSNAFIPGWVATIDGEETIVYPANYAFQGILVPEGEHEILLEYPSPYGRVVSKILR